VDPGLRAYLLLRVTVEGRDEEGTRQALRHAATELTEAESHKVVELLSKTISGTSRNWLSRLR